MELPGLELTAGEVFCSDQCLQKWGFVPIVGIFRVMWGSLFFEWGFFLKVGIFRVEWGFIYLSEKAINLALSGLWSKLTHKKPIKIV